MKVPNLFPTIPNTLEFAQVRLTSAEKSLEAAKQEWKMAKRKRREAKLVAARARKQLKRAKKELTDARIVFASTRQIYGRPEYLPVDERHPIHPIDVNGINKTAGEWYHLLYGQVYGIPVCVLRLTNTYGPRMRVKDARQTFLGIWLRLVLTGEEIA